MATKISPEERAKFFRAFPQIPDNFTSEEQFEKWVSQHAEVSAVLNKTELHGRPWEYIKPPDQIDTHIPTVDQKNDDHSKKQHGLTHGESADEDVSDMSLSDALINNEHYQNIIENTVDDWNKLHPDQKITQAFVTDENGRKIINPEITGKAEMPGKIQDIEKRATDTYTMAYGTRALKAAQIAEKKKVYRKAIDDPLFARLQKEIHLGATPKDAYDRFVKSYPDKARAYLSMRKLPRGSREYAELQQALKRRQASLKEEEKKKGEERKAEEKQRKEWDKEYYKARGRIFVRNKNVIHGGVQAFDAEVASSLTNAVNAERLADRGQGVTYTNDVYEKRLRDKVRKASVEKMFREEPTRAQYLMRFDPKLKAEYEQWQKATKAAIDPAKRFKDSKEDPRIKSLHADIKDATNAEYQKQLEESRKGKGKWSRGIWYPDSKAGYRPPDRQAIEAEIRKGKLLDFANENPDLVRDYATKNKDPEMASAYKAHQEQLRQKEQAKKLGEKRGLFQRFFGRGTDAEGLTIGQQAASPIGLIEPSVQSPPSPEDTRPQPMRTSPPAAQPEEPQEKQGWPNRVRQRFNRQIPEERTEGKPEKPRFRSPTQRIRERGRETAKSVGRNLDKRMGGVGSKLNTRLKNLRGSLPGSGKIPTNPEDAAKKLAEQAAKRIIMMPQTWVAIGGGVLIILLLILILAISYALFGEPEDDELPPITPTPTPFISPAAPVPISLAITKTGPVNSKVNDELEYTITVNHSGISGEIIVTDTLFGEAEFVRADPAPQKSDISTDTRGNLQSVVWRIPISSTTTQAAIQANENCVLGAPQNGKWAPLNQYDAYFIQAATEFGVPANLLKSMAMIESAGKGHINPATGKPWERDDGFGDGLSVGLMQVKPSIWQSLVPDADAYDPLGNIRLGAAIMAKAIEDHGSWENAIRRVYLPTDDPNGTSQDEYISTVEQYMAELNASPCTENNNPPQGTISPSSTPTQKGNTISITITVKPKTNNTYIYNLAEVRQ